MASLRTTRLIVLLMTFLIALGACAQDSPEQEDETTGSVEVSQDPVLLPGDARAIVEELNTGSETANATMDENLQNSIETSPARDIDDAFYKRFRALGRTTASGVDRDIEQVTAYVPRQTTYPARFMAYVRLVPVDNPDAGPISRLRLYEKAAADEPWKLAMYVTVPPEYPAPDIRLDADGFAEQVTDEREGDLKLDPARVPEEFSNYLSGYAEGTESTIFAPGRFTSELSQSYKASVDEDAQAQITTSIGVTPGEREVEAFETTDGGALAVFSVDVVTSYAAAPGGRTLNLTTGSEGLLPPGTYETIERTVIHMVAAEVPPAPADELVEIVGSTSGVVAFEHSP